MAGLYSTLDKVKVVATILPQAITGTTAGTVVDTYGYNSVGFIVTVGTVTTADADNTYTLSFSHGDQSDKGDAASAASYVTAIQGTLTDLKVAATTGDEVTYTWNYTGNKRYVYVTWTEAGTAAMSTAAYVALGVPTKSPVSN